MKQINFSNDARFSGLLLSRRLPPPGANLAARIVAAAMRAPEIISNFSFSQWLQELFRDFMLPQPAYALSGVLVVGMLAGFLWGPMMVMEDNAAFAHTILADEGDLP